MSDDRKRRPRGASAKGDFEQSKAVALEEMLKERSAQQTKTEKLRALRKQRDSRAPKDK